MNPHLKKAMKVLTIAFVVLFIVGPITSTVIYFTGKALIKEKGV